MKVTSINLHGADGYWLVADNLITSDGSRHVHCLRANDLAPNPDQLYSDGAFWLLKWQDDTTAVIENVNFGGALFCSKPTVSNDVDCTSLVRLSLPGQRDKDDAGENKWLWKLIHLFDGMQIMNTLNKGCLTVSRAFSTEVHYTGVFISEGTTDTPPHSLFFLEEHDKLFVFTRRLPSPFNALYSRVAVFRAHSERVLYIKAYPVRRQDSMKLWIWQQLQGLPEWMSLALSVIIIVPDPSIHQLNRQQQNEG